ncbi:MAG: bifunctional [glutamine synthetase] adenylyltransferase/[glutamine synthetase]-adenylyl-L-tyrosine phosphorylase, partial [Rickettsiales bacterium]|nr:bifunctional [glutamine synthetase] adenylyltransferase/[glutamine synthetase]-adenylyl-L-tyrosine phosphorylase [Rickettsiales bacterium]
MQFLEQIILSDHYPKAGDEKNALKWLRMADEHFTTITSIKGYDRLLSAIFGNSPFLTHLMFKNVEFVNQLFSDGPESCLEALLDELNHYSVDDFKKDAEIMQVLRSAKQKISLLVAISDISCHWELEKITESLSRFAETAVRMVTDYLIHNAVQNHNLQIDAYQKRDAASGLIVLAMGKLGADELNYSSDIDLILLYDHQQDGLTYTGTKSLQHLFISIGKRMISIMQDRTEDGYVFRVDLRLRPDPSSTPIVMSAHAALAYYERVGQNWERMCYIKARVIAGDRHAGHQYLKALEPFIWRKYLDFAMIEDIHSVKRQIEAKNIGKDDSLYNYNIKLGRGGIREIEFFATIQQLIWGGRETTVRRIKTCDAIRALTQCEKVHKEACDDLIDAYVYLRNLEHCLQMVEDQQTHTLPATEQKMYEIAVFMHYDAVETFISELRTKLLTVQMHYMKLGEASPSLGTGYGNLVFTGSENDPETLDNLEHIGFSNVEAISNLIRGWHHGRARATNNKRARELLTELTPALLKAMTETANPDKAFINFNEFLSHTPAGVQVFSLFLQNPMLIELVAEIMGSYPYLANNLIRKPVLLEYVFSQDFMEPSMPIVELQVKLKSMLKTAKHYEDILDITRHWTHDRQFRVGVHLIKNMITPVEARTNLTKIAETVLSELLIHVKEEFELSHGKVKGGEFIFVALGKLGGYNLGFGSDIDLIFVYDCPENIIESDGPSKLSINEYYSRLSRRFISAFSALTSEGRLYEIDTRLSPSGKDSPVAITFKAFERYYLEHVAWTWEYMALTKARVITTTNGLATRVMKTITEAL